MKNLRILLKIFILILVLIAGMSVAESLRDSVKIAVEAEDLVPVYESTKLQINPFPRTSGKYSVILHKDSLVWKANLPQKGIYTLFFRARAGYGEDRLFATKSNQKYRVNLTDRAIAVYAKNETLEWISSGTNYLWWFSEPLNLDAGENTIVLSSPWEDAHVDQLILTSDVNFKPKEGYIAEVATKKDSTLSVWVGDAYLKFDPYKNALKKISDAKASINVLRGGTGYSGVYIRNIDASRMRHIRMHMSSFRSPNGVSLPRTSMRILKLCYTDVMGNAVAADALTEVNRLGSLDLAPQTTTLIWFLVDVPEGQEPGEYIGKLNIKDITSQEEKELDINIKVSRLILPDSDDLAEFIWSGYQAIWQNDSWQSAKPYWEDDIAHGTDSFRLITYQNIGYQFDEEGNLVGDIDFSWMNLHIKYLKETGGYFLLNWSLGHETARSLRCYARGLPLYEKGAKLEFMSEPWKRAFKTLVTSVTEHLVANGIAKDRILQYIYDEYLGEDFIRVGRLLRKWDPSLLIFSDVSSSLEVYKKAAPYLDIWCPQFSYIDDMAKDGRLEFMRSTGKPIWFYDASYENRLWSAYDKHRLKFWLAYKYKLQGCALWRYAGGSVGTVYWPMDVELGGSPVTSRRWEGWWSGCQDYRILKMAEKRFAGQQDKLDRIKILVDEVLASPNSSTLAENARVEIIQMLEKTSEQ